MSTFLVCAFQVSTALPRLRDAASDYAAAAVTSLMIRLENNAAAAAEADLAHVGRGCLSLLAKTTQSSRVTLLKE